MIKELFNITDVETMSGMIEDLSYIKMHHPQIDGVIIPHHLYKHLKHHMNQEIFSEIKDEPVTFFGFKLYVEVKP